MMKNNSYAMFVFAVMMALTFVNTSLLAQFPGSGTQSSPYLISTRDDLDTLAKYVENGSGWTTGKYFRLQHDIGSISGPWTKSIGTFAGLTNPNDTVHIFRGHFDGNNKTIYLNINNATGSTSSFPTGLFRMIIGGSVKNLTLQGTVAGILKVGGIVGEMRDGTIENCTNLATISGYSHIGGIVGYFFNKDASTSIINCRNNANITGDVRIGGIAGAIEATTSTQLSTISMCYNFGTIAADITAGGICGENIANGAIELSINQGRVNGNNYVGGIAGVNNNTIEQCINLGIVQGNSNIGGIVGFNSPADGTGVINYCMNAGVVAGAGICGSNGRNFVSPSDPPASSGTIAYSLNVGCASGKGIADINATVSIIQHCYYDKQLTLNGGPDVIGSFEGKYTSELVGSALSSVLGSNWVYLANKYPLISALSNNNYAIVASSPVFFDALDDRLTISKNFLADITNSVTWNTSFNKITFDNTGKSTILLSLNDTLNCVRSDSRKRIPINIISVPDDNLYNVIVEAWPTAGGVVTGGGLYEAESVATITATANPHYRFVHWEDLPSGMKFSISPEHSIAINRDCRFRAHFYIDSFMLNLTASPNYMGYIVGVGSYPYGYNAKFWAVPNYGYHFVKWTDENSEIYTDSIEGNIYIFENRHLTAHFEIDTFKIKVSVEPFSYGIATVDGKEEGEYVYLTELELSTKGHDTCFHFVKWTALGDTTTISTELDFILTLTADTHLVAHYTETKRKVILRTEPPEVAELIELIGGGEDFPCFPITTNINFIISNVEKYDSLYKFMYWTLDSPTGDIISPQTDFKLDVTRDYTLIANFSLLEYPQYILFLSSEPEEGGTTMGAGSYDTNALVSIEAIPNADSGYRFVNWQTEDGTIISNQNPYQFVLTQDTILVARFSNDYVLSTSVQPNSIMGTIVGNSAGLYPYGSTIYLEAVVSDTARFQFIHWKNNADNILGTDTTLEFFITKDTTIIAVFDTTLTIKDLSNLTMFRLSPNPASTRLIMSMENPIELLDGSNINIVLLDMLGNDVMQITDETFAADSWNKEVDVSNLPTGTYFLRVSIGKDAYIGKVIIQR